MSTLCRTPRSKPRGGISCTDATCFPLRCGTPPHRSPSLQTWCHGMALKGVAVPAHSSSSLYMSLQFSTRTHLIRKSTRQPTANPKIALKGKTEQATHWMSAWFEVTWVLRGRWPTLVSPKCLQRSFVHNVCVCVWAVSRETDMCLTPTIRWTLLFDCLFVCG